MKKRMFAVMAGLLALTMALSACSSNSSAGGSSTAGAPATETNIKLATGGTSGTYYAFGGVVAQAVTDATGIKFDVQSTGASKANIGLIADGEVDMAIVQNDVMDYAYNGTDLFEGEKTDNFNAMAAMYAEVCQVVANPAAGIETIADLKGKRVSVGDAGSGVEFNAKQILEAYGVTFDDIQKQNLSFGDSANAMKDNKIDAFFCTAGAPTTAVMELSSTNDVKILNVDGAEAETLIAKYPFYTSYTIPKDTYSGMTEDATTVSVKATFIVSPELSEDVVYNMTKAIFEGKEDITAGHAKGAEIDPAYAVEGVSVPFHPGAEKYFKEIGALK
ncbi:MAG: TAXI family TRAP transporter solute-binding subunit [Lachnospiraceae bacterium]|nr:TAXI family TRAP transporter solute-binding subunit [Lachnospiraceae bacterium]